MTLTPSSQRNDPLAWAGNQCGHMAIGFGLLLLRSAGTAALFAMWWDYIMASQAFTGR